MKTIKRWGGACLLALAVFAVDQAIKASIRRLPLGAVGFRLPGLAEITHCTNTGVAFSLMEGRTILIAVLSALLMIALVVVMGRALHPAPAARLALGVLIGGGMGNWMDRLIYGAVTDYIRLLPIDFPVFNLADIAITVSVACLILLMLTGKLEETPGEHHGEHH